MAQPYPYTPPPAAGPGMPPIPPTRPSSNTWIIVLAVGGGVGLFFIVLAVLAVSGVRRYVSLAKTAEGLNAVGAISKDAVAAYERDTEGGPALCGSAPHPVPRSASDIAGKKYMSTPSDWTDGPSEAGFACLRFEMTMPQYYQYDYTSTGPQGRFTAMAKGDLDGDGELSEISLDGEVDRSTKTVRVAPVPKQVRPEE